MARVAHPKDLGLTGSAATRYTAWRSRNPTDAARFDRLTRGGQRNIATTWTQPIKGRPAATQAVRLADTYRRADVAQASKRRRKVNRYADSLVALPAAERRLRSAHPVNLTPSEERAMWDRYDRMMGNVRHGR